MLHPFTITSSNYHAASSFYNKQEYIISISGKHIPLLNPYYYIIEFPLFLFILNLNNIRTIFYNR